MYQKLFLLFLLLTLISCNKQSKGDELSRGSTLIVSEVIRDTMSNVTGLTEKEINRDSLKGYERVKSQLQGTWISTEDSNYVMVFKGDWVYDTYIGEEESISKSKFLLGLKCSGEPDELTSNQLTLVKIEEGLCYSLDYVNENHLQLTYLSRGNILSFVRKK